LSVGAILGLVGLNAWFVGVGAGVLFGLRGWVSWGELGRLLGVAYMLGVAALGVVWTWLLVAGLDLSVAAILLSGVVVAGTGSLAGLRAGRRLPPFPRVVAPRLSLVSALFGAAIVVYFEALFRAGRLAGLYEFDGWSFWVPKAQAIYYFGGLDRQLFHDLPGQSYPPVVPALEAASFHFVGAADVVTLHLQFWFLLAGFVGAVLGLLSRRVPAILLWPPLLLVLVTPQVVDHALQPQADMLLDELFALGALLVALWLLDGERWMLWGGTLLLAAAMLTKREGYVLGACLLAAALVATARRAREAWPLLLLCGLLAFAATVPWRIFIAVRDLGGGGPEAGGTGLFTNGDRAWPSLRLALSVLFDFDIWLVVMPLLLLALAVAFIGRDRLLGTFGVTLTVLCVAGFTWSTWAFPSLPVTKEAAVNPIVRFTGALVIATAGLVPLLLAGPRRTE
jgi:hypothetical protein